MNTTPDGAAAPNTDLVIDRVLRAPRAKLWRAWTEPALLAPWWCPKPWTTEVRALELRPGGAFHTFMQGPDGDTSDNPGAFVEIVSMERLVWTSMLTRGWRPAVPWMPMTAVIRFADAPGGGTRYHVTAMHPDVATRDRHAQMGFFDGWNLAIDQLDDCALALPDVR